MPRRTQTVDHRTIASGTLVFRDVLFSMWPGSPTTLWRMVKTGEFPAPRTYVGRRPAWLIDDLRKVCSGQWKVEAA